MSNFSNQLKKFLFIMVAFYGTGQESYASSQDEINQSIYQYQDPASEYNNYSSFYVVMEKLTTDNFNHWYVTYNEALNTNKKKILGQYPNYSEKTIEEYSRSIDTYYAVGNPKTILKKHGDDLKKVHVIIESYYAAKDMKEVLRNFNPEKEDTYFNTSDVWIVYATSLNRQQKNLYELKDWPNHIEMACSVASHKQHPLVQHLGIHRNPLYSEISKFNKHPQIALLLHSFAAHVMLDAYSHKLYMANKPKQIMRKMMLRVVRNKRDHIKYIHGEKGSIHRVLDTDGKSTYFDIEQKDWPLWYLKDNYLGHVFKSVFSLEDLKNLAFKNK